MKVMFILDDLKEVYFKNDYVIISYIDACNDCYFRIFVKRTYVMNDGCSTLECLATYCHPFGPLKMCIELV